MGLCRAFRPCITCPSLAIEGFLRFHGFGYFAGPGKPFTAVMLPFWWRKSFSFCRATSARISQREVSEHLRPRPVAKQSTSDRSHGQASVANLQIVAGTAHTRILAKKAALRLLETCFRSIGGQLGVFKQFENAGLTSHNGFGEVGSSRTLYGLHQCDGSEPSEPICTTSFRM